MNNLHVVTAAGAVPREKFLSIDQVMELTTLKKSTVYRLAREGSFPQPVRLSPRRSGWVESQVRAWVHQRISAAAATPTSSPEAA
jgi:prophage regulatory protein